MKISETGNKNYLLTGKQNSAVKTVQETPNQTNEEDKAVQIAISKEGHESYRNNLSKLEGYNQRRITDQDYSEMLNKSVLNDGRISSELHSLMQEFSSKETDRTSDGYIKNLFKAYTTLYDEIKKGYQEGKRDLWAIESPNGVQSFRQITEAEELADLEAAYAKISKFLEKRSIGAIEEEKRVKEAIRLDEAAIFTESRKRSNPKIYEEEQPVPIIKVEDIEDTLNTGRVQFLEKYAMFQNQTEFSKGITDILNTMFQNNIV